MAVPDRPLDLEESAEVRRFYRLETRLLDSHRYEEWLDLLTDQVTYRIPVRETREEPDKELQGRFYHVDDDRFQLQLRVDRLQTEFAWAEDPPTRTRHLLYPTRALELEDGRVQTLTNLLLVVTRRNESSSILSGEREDVLRAVDGEWKLDHRIVRLDQAVLPVRSLSFFI